MVVTLHTQGHGEKKCVSLLLLIYGFTLDK